jgi:hypothetical protein
VGKPTISWPKLTECHLVTFLHVASPGSILNVPSKISDLAFEPPMLATLVRTLPQGPEWEYELKLDGYRLQAIKDGDKVRLYSRRGNDFTKKVRPDRHERFKD